MKTVKFQQPIYYILLLILILNVSVNGQEKLEISRLSNNINFDGRFDEDAWKEIQPLPLIMLMPDYGGVPSEETIVKIAYNDDYLYVGARLFDSQSDRMKSQLKRDDWKYSCDWLTIILDTFNDKENTVVFATSPSGLRTDVAFSIDVSDLMRDMNLSWNTFWDVKTIIDDKGWNAEIRIPFSSLRFQEENSKVVMGLCISRYIPRKYEAYVFPKTDLKH